MAVSSISPAQVAYLGETWFVGFDFRGWVPSTITPVSTVVTARNAAGEDKTGDVLSGAVVSGTKAGAWFANFLTGETYTIIAHTTLSNGEKPKHSMTITTDTL